LSKLFATKVATVFRHSVEVRQ